MTETPYFSIVLPTFNRAQMLKRAVGSLLMQTMPDWELLVIDDGSTDETREVVNAFSDSRIKYVYQENCERSAARNNGIELASGKYICFLDSDDFYLPHHLEVFFEGIRKLGEPVAFFYSKLFNEMNEVLFLPEETDFAASNPLEFVTKNIIGPPQVCIHSKILKEIRFNPKLTVGEDLNLWLRILDKYPDIYIMDSRTLVVGMHEGRSVNILHKNNYRHSLDSFMLTIKDQGIRRKISIQQRNAFIGDCYLGMCKYHIFQQQKIKAFAMIMISLFYKPKYQLKFKINIIYCILFKFSKALELMK